jgi:hypothetical protein
MPNVKAIDATKLTSAVTVTNATETAFLTSPAVPTTLPTNKVSVDFTCELTVGTSGTTATLKIYRGTSTGGTLIYTSDAFTVVAGSKYSLEAATVDNLQGTESAQYTCSVTVGSGAANSTVDNAVATVMVF